MPDPRCNPTLSRALLGGMRCAGCIAVALLPASALAGCGSAHGTSSSPRGTVVARVGRATIRRAEVDHWASAISRGNAVATALGHADGTPRERALEFLISADWVLGETGERGLSVSRAAIERGLQGKIGGAPNGRAEFAEELASTGQTIADVELEVRSTLAVAALRGAVSKSVPAVRAAEVASYYAHHRGRFRIPDRRLVDLIELLPSYAKAVALGRRLGPGESFAKRAIRELVRRESPAEAADRMNGQLVHMIFTATPGRVARPAIFNHRWVIAVVRKLIPAGIQPLAAVKGELSQTLAGERRQRALERFAAAFLRKWTARTSCSPGYVVRQCSEYRGVRKAEPDPLTQG